MKKHYLEHNLWCHCQMDFDGVFESQEEKSFTTKEELFEKNRIKNEDVVKKFKIEEDDKTNGFHFLVVNNKVRCTYSIDFELDAPVYDEDIEKLHKTVNNINVYIRWSKELIEKYNRYGSIYKRKIEDANNSAAIL